MNEFQKADLKKDGAMLIQSLVESQKPGKKNVEELRRFKGNHKLGANDVRATWIVSIVERGDLSLEEAKSVIEESKGKHKRNMRKAWKIAKTQLETKAK